MSATLARRLSVAYVGNVGRHLNGGYNLNAAVPGPGPLTSREPLYQRFAAMGMPGISQTINDKCDCTSSNYNGLQVQASKRYTNGYSLQVSYTWAKAMDFGQASFLPTNQYDARTSYGPADFDREQVPTIGHTYELPFGPGHHLLSDSRGIVKQLVAGWSLSGITTLESGLPFSPTLANNSNLNSNQSKRPTSPAIRPAVSRRTAMNVLTPRTFRLRPCTRSECGTKFTTRTEPVPSRLVAGEELSVC